MLGSACLPCPAGSLSSTFDRTTRPFSKLARDAICQLSKHLLPLFIFHGAQLDSFKRSPLDYLSPLSFSQQMKLLRSAGVTEWDPKGVDAFLHAAAMAKEVPELLFGLEEAKLDPNHFFKSLLSICVIDPCIASLLIECGTQVNPFPQFGGRPLCKCIEGGKSDVAHILLSCGAKTILDGYEPTGARQTTWRPKEPRVWQSINLIEPEGLLSHLLWHKLGPTCNFHTRHVVGLRSLVFCLC